MKKAITVLLFTGVHLSFEGMQSAMHDSICTLLTDLKTPVSLQEKSRNYYFLLLLSCAK